MIRQYPPIQNDMVYIELNHSLKKAITDIEIKIFEPKSIVDKQLKKTDNIEK